MSDLATWARGSHTSDGITHDTYRKGTGPGVVVIHEIPGITPDVIAFADEVVAQGFTVVMPRLFGDPETARRRRRSRRSFPGSASARSSPSSRWARPPRSPAGCAPSRPTCTTSSVDRGWARSGCASPVGTPSR
ncbi:MAG: dienelactone hydrolase family protein [Nocardioides sp.]